MGWRTVRNTFDHGFTEAGNLAFLSLLTLFPFFIVVTRIAGMFGRTGDGMAAINQFLESVPQGVADLLRQPVADVLALPSNNVLTFGILVGLWSTASFIEATREILYRAYRTESSRPFWQYRLGNIALVVGSVLLMLAAFSAEVALAGVETLVMGSLAEDGEMLDWLPVSRLVPGAALSIAVYLVFLSLTPGGVRNRGARWPGAALTTIVWIAATLLLPRVIGLLGDYDRTYGSLAGVMIALIFFWIVGLGFVAGAELNAALAHPMESRQKARTTAAEE